MTPILQRFTTPTSPGALLQSIHPDLGIRLAGGRLSGVVTRVEPVPDGFEVVISVPTGWNEAVVAVGLDMDGVRHVATYECTGSTGTSPSITRSDRGVPDRTRGRRRSPRTVTVFVRQGDSGPVSLALVGGAMLGARVYLGATETTPGPSARESSDRAGTDSADPRGCSVSFARSQVHVLDSGAGGPLLEIAESAGLTPRFGCRRGVCHRCTTQLLAGTTVNTRDGTVSEPGDAVRICVSTPVTNVELNL